MLNTAEGAPLTSERFIQPAAVRGHSAAAERPSYSIFTPLVLLAAALVLWFAFQTVQLATERSELAAIKANQSTQVETATKIRIALDSLAASTQRLADAGNTNAQLIVNELQKRGVTINTSGNKKP